MSKQKNKRTRGRIEGLLDPQTVGQIERMAEAEERPVRWMVGTLLLEAVKARNARVEAGQ